MSARPPGWNKTLADLFDEMERGERLFATDEEREWAVDYERSLLPPGTAFPRGGQVWEALDDCDVQVEYIFAAPGGGGGEGRLAKGERVRIMEGGVDAAPIVVCFLPLRYDALHERHVPEDVRGSPRYTNYSLAVTTAYFNAHFAPVGDGLAR